jgi:Skp family chaperone for outer membrane proteins
MRLSATPFRRAPRIRTFLASSASSILAVGALALLGLAVTAGPASAAPGPVAGPGPAAAAAAPAPSGPIRIAVANPARVFNEMQETKSLQAKMVEDEKRFTAEKQDREKQIEQLKTSRQNLNPSHPQYEELSNQFLKATIEYKVWVDSRRLIAEQTQKRQMKMLFEKIQDAIAEVAKDRQVDVVIADNKDPLPSDATLEQVDIRALRGAILSKEVLFAGPRADLTDAVLTLLDARYKGAGAAAAGAPGQPGAGAAPVPAAAVLPTVK